MKRPTIKEVAQCAGVSVGSVSNVLHGRHVLRSTRERVLHAVANLSYRPDTIAQSLISRRRHDGAPQVPDASMPRLSTVGYISVDYIARIGVLPHRNDRVTASSIDRALGGPAANVAVHAAALGGRYAVESELITALGFDGESEWALAELLERGVSTYGIDRRHGNRLSRCIVLLENGGNRTIINEPFELASTDISRYLGRTQDVRNAGERHCLHVEGYQVPGLRESIRDAQAEGVLTSMHTTGLPQEWHSVEGLQTLASMFDLMFLNREVAERAAGNRASAEELINWLSKSLQDGDALAWLVLTLDADGAALLRPENDPIYVPAPVVRVVDLTGAGDALAGVFLAVWLNGSSPLEALRRAVVAASSSITAQSAQSVRLSHRELESLVENGPVGNELRRLEPTTFASTAS